jgi:hypothetical protein
MSGLNGQKYVTLVDDKNVHLYAETEATVCGIPIPVASGAEWTYAEPEKVCKACDKNATTYEDARDLPEPETPLASDKGKKKG